MTSKSGLAEYWRERIEAARSDPDEARALLRAFAELADSAVGAVGAEGADPVLVAYVAERIRDWAEANFERDAAAAAFWTKKPAHAPLSAVAAKKRQRAVAEVLRLSRVEGLPLEEAYLKAADVVHLSPTQVRDHYKAFQKGSAAPREFVPVLMHLSRGDRLKALAPGKRGRPPKPE